MLQFRSTFRPLSIVIPAYNEADRLPGTLRSLRQFLLEDLNDGANVEVIVVDDGSEDGTGVVVREMQMQWPSLKCISFKRNCGKGAAVHEGLRAVRTPWVLIADADMSTPWSELKKLMALGDSFSLIMGSRALSQSQILVPQHWFRQGMGKTFNHILRRLVGLPFRDTQCGFKLLQNDLFFREVLLPQLRVKRFAWDVELILFLRKHEKKVVEVPVQWSHQEHSRVRILSDSIEMLWAVLKLKIRMPQASKQRLTSR